MSLFDDIKAILRFIVGTIAVVFLLAWGIPVFIFKCDPYITFVLMFLIISFWWKWTHYEKG